MGAICDFDKTDHFTLKRHEVSSEAAVLNKPQKIV